IVVTLGVASACGPTGPVSASQSGPSGTLTVFAASSLNAAFTRIGAVFDKRHPGTIVKFSFAASSSLAAQIQQGALGDVFASADQPNMQKVIQAGLTSQMPIVIARNDLEIVVAKGNPKHVEALADLARSGLVVVLCAPAVPCGHYAARTLQKAGVSVEPASQATDVKSVLRQVALGEGAAGLVQHAGVNCG